MFAGTEQIRFVIGAATTVEQVGQGADLHLIGPFGLGGHGKGAVDGVLPLVFDSGNVFPGAFAPAFDLVLTGSHDGSPPTRGGLHKQYCDLGMVQKLD